MSAEALRQVLDQWAKPPAELVDKLPKGGTTLDCMGHAVATFSDVCALLAIEH